MAQELLEPIALGDAVTEVVPRLRQTLEQAEAHESFLRSKLDEQKAEIGKIRRALSVFDPEYQKPTNSPGRPKKNGMARVGRRTAAGTSTGHGITVEGCAPIVAEILKQTDGGKSNKHIAQRDLVKTLDIDQSKISASFKYLREIEFLRKAGRSPDGRTDVFAVMDKFAYDKAVKAIEGDD